MLTAICAFTPAILSGEGSAHGGDRGLGERVAVRVRGTEEREEDRNVSGPEGAPPPPRGDPVVVKLECINLPPPPKNSPCQIYIWVEASRTSGGVLYLGGGLDCGWGFEPRMGHAGNDPTKGSPVSLQASGFLSDVIDLS